MSELLDCPFCGMEADIEDGDVIHRATTWWIDSHTGTDAPRRSYYGLRQIMDMKIAGTMPDSSGQCWEIHCVPYYGGCGASIVADTYDDVISKWNKRV